MSDFIKTSISPEPSIFNINSFVTEKKRNKSKTKFLKITNEYKQGITSKEKNILSSHSYSHCLLPTETYIFQPEKGISPSLLTIETLDGRRILSIEKKISSP